MISRWNVWRDEKLKRMRNVGKSVNVKKNEYNLMSTIFFYLNLSKILHFFLKQKERKNINNLIIRRMWLNFNIK